MFAKRAQGNAVVNRLTLALQAYRGELFDLTNSNPTKAGIDYPLDELSEVIARASRAAYEPEALGLRSAREAVAQELGCDAADIVITASTSEAYSFLFKLLCDAGDAVLTATPSYPLLEHLAALEMIDLQYFALDFHRRWEIDPERIRRSRTNRTRSIVIINPNNPTGSYVTAEEQDSIAHEGLPVIADEVFHPFAFGTAAPSFVRKDILTFTLGGLSKSAGLPHFKLGWMRVSGPGKDQAVRALELIADNFLSVGTAVQVALPELLTIAPGIRQAIQKQTSANLQVLRTALDACPAARLLPIEGGWSAIVRVPRLGSDDELTLRFLQEYGVLVHPGYFFDFEAEGFVVLSLLTTREVFSEGVKRLVSSLVS